MFGEAIKSDMKTRKMAIAIWLAILACFISGDGFAEDVDGGRFVHSGDGRIELFNAKNGLLFSGEYGLGGRYNQTSLDRISLVFGATKEDPLADISLRLIAFLDYLQDHFNPTARIEIVSGWRSPAYNARLRKDGRLAATASLHQYGMAADIVIDKVSSERVWNFIRRLGFGGAGYYHGRTVHVDVGPARFWDETSSGVGSGLADDNKLIGLVTGYDRYRPGELVVLRFIRMTGFPIGVSPDFVLERIDYSSGPKKVDVGRPQFNIDVDGQCPLFGTISDMMNIRYRLPDSLPSGRYTLRVRFCKNEWEAMPEEVATPPFEIAPSGEKTGLKTKD